MPEREGEWKRVEAVALIPWFVRFMLDDVIVGDFAAIEFRSILEHGMWFLVYT